MLNLPINNPAFKNISNQLPRVDQLNPALELQVFQHNFQHYLNSCTLFPSNFSPQSKDETQESSNEILNDLSIDFSKVYKQFELTLNKKLDSPLCKCRYFTLKVYLRPLQNFVFPENEKVELQFLVYSEDGRQITKNMKGKDIVRGNHIQCLSYFTLEKVHFAYLKIQITEVSSHFVGKTFCIKIKPKMNDFLKKMGWRIKSICVKNVVVKAKDHKSMNSII